MLTVLMCTLPGLLAMLWFFGAGVLLQLCAALAGALAMESLAALLRGRSVWRHLKDGSALLAGWLVGLCFPPLAPWWLASLAAILGVGLGKHVYGGLGQNIFNPAMTGYALVLVSFPLQLTQGWPDAATGSAVMLIDDRGQVLADAISAATPLDQYKQALVRDLSQGAQLTIDATTFAWQMINLAFLVGGLILLSRGLIRWQIPVSMLTAFTLCSLIASPSGDQVLSFSLFQLSSGAVMLGAFFIATDPVTAATSRQGQLLFGAGIGLLLFLIRRYSAWPDGIAFAVLLMNLCVPLLDYYTRPRVYGHSKATRGIQGR
ncbi:electron transport complex subunit RsxD [Allohahella marinimesophila]|uniref:Ion-translocating oxidoreductase complex subunit D n=2 Tax=Allohahella marinimesophila TaxID=1054972 RepID=A0ABP7Q5B2_9GAMM